MSEVPVKMTVNGQPVEESVEPRVLLIHFLRDKLGLTGPHVGCETSHCGACTVDLDGKSDQVLVEIDAEDESAAVELLSDPTRQIAEGIVLLTSRTEAASVSEVVSTLRDLAGVKDVWSISPVFFVRQPRKF